MNEIIGPTLHVWHYSWKDYTVGKKRYRPLTYMLWTVKNFFYNMRELYYWLYAFAHRGLYGWDRRDTWNLDHYISKVLAESIEYLRGHRRGHPCWCEHTMSVTCHCDEKWDSILASISAGLRSGSEWRDDMELDENDERKKQHDYAMQLLVEHWFRLWD